MSPARSHFSHKGFTLINPGFRRDDTAVQRKAENGFTLIELLVVIAIIAVLAVVVVLTLNPGQLILQSRDSTRLSDLASLQSAVALYQTDRAINGTVSLGSSSIVYVSLPDPAATTTAGTTCSTMGLPALPPAYTYHCAASSTFRKVDGSGWIPVNLSSISSGAPLGQLPIDPTNASSSRSYLTYTTNGTQYEVTSQIESSKYKLGGSNDVASLDGGTQTSLYEKGTNLTLEPLDYGDSSLVGYWTFDEGSGSIAYDYSGNNATGSWSGTQVGTSGYYSAGRVGAWAGAFASTSPNLVSVSSTAALDTPNTLTIVAWINPVAGENGRIVQKDDRASSAYTRLWETGAISGAFRMELWHSDGTNVLAYGGALAANTWQQIVMAFDGNNVLMYKNGVLTGTTPFAGNIRVSAGTPISIGGQWGSAEWYTGLIDDVRVYNRALSAAEIQAMYNATK